MPATLLSPAQIDRIVERQAHLVTPSAAARRLLDLTSDPRLDVPSRQIASILGSEPALAAQVLQWVNSAIFALPSPVSDIGRAVPLLGLSRIRALALAQAFFTKAAREEMAVYGVKGITFCLHGLETAFGAAFLMKRHEPEREGDAFTAGLLHDIGMLLMEGAAENLDGQPPLLPANRPLCQLERERYGVDHTVLGRSLAAQWRLSDEQKSVIAGHHQEPRRSQAAPWTGDPRSAAPPPPTPDILPLVVQIADHCSERRLMLSTAATQEGDLRTYRDLMPDEASFVAVEEAMDDAGPMLASLFGDVTL
ncbi:MAG: HDOD domain-containing protein [Nitrospirota bacterium]|jgi:HD-like signal output (HDOD) protein